jgi:hypothetical protein
MIKRILSFLLAIWFIAMLLLIHAAFSKDAFR